AQDLFSRSNQDAFTAEGLNTSMDRSIHKENSSSQHRVSLDHMTDVAIRSNFDPKLLGAHLLTLAGEDNGLELSIAYTSIVVKARRARQKRL
ncbi:MAG: hypothetical protein KF686_10500, partial [Ramlibacter sp.]|nr:hypothetical protein [Ramlibacter sp.]